MAHFAEIDDNNVVLRVLVIDNKDTIDPATGEEKEEIGQKFCQDLFGGKWVQTSYNANFRKNYAGIGYTYNSEIDGFVPPKEYDSWVLNVETGRWDPPVPCPEDNKEYSWDEKNKQWISQD
jgi:hypothetical protein